MAVDEKAVVPPNEKSQTPQDSDVEEYSTKVSERKLLRKLDFKLLPALTLLYLLSFLDRSNVGNARVEGLATDVGMTGDQYLTGLTLYFIGYVLFEIPCNVVMKLWTPRMWLPTLTLVWGIVSTLMGVINNYAGFLAVRFFLGVAESGLFPGIVYYLSVCVYGTCPNGTLSDCCRCGTSEKKGISALLFSFPLLLWPEHLVVY